MAKQFELNGKVAIVTGASRGIGLAIVNHLAQAGAKAVITGRKRDGLDQAVAELQQKSDGELDIIGIVAHNGNKDSLKNLVKQTLAQYGTVDILVNNAATNPHFGTLLEAEDSLWQKIIEVNLMGTVWLTQQVVPVFRSCGGGKIINVSSVNGLRPGSYQGIYSITKAALVSLTQTLAVELAADNVQVNAIAPGLIKTRFSETLWSNSSLRESIVKRTPIGRIGEPDDLGGIALYLASPASDFTTGQVFVVDGGLSVPML